MFIVVFFLNQFITEKIKEEFMRWAIINGLSGANWPFKRFVSFSLNVIQKLKKVMNWYGIYWFWGRSNWRFFSWNNENEKDDIADKSFYKWWCQSTRYQTRDIFDALNDRNHDNCKFDKRNSKPEMYWEIDRSFAQFDEFDSWEESAKK